MTGYETEYSDWTPSTDDAGHTFMLELEELDYVNESTYREQITFNGYVNDAGYVFVNYTDALDETIGTNISIYEYNTTTGNGTLLYWDNRTGNNDFTFNVLGSNISNCFEVTLYLDHVSFGNVTDSFFVCGSDRPYINITNRTWLDDLFDTNYGDNPWNIDFPQFHYRMGIDRCNHPVNVYCTWCTCSVVHT